MKTILQATLVVALFCVLGCDPAPGANLPKKGEPPPPPGAMNKSTYKPGKEDKNSKGGKIAPPVGKP
jgi:hypothetical protein